MLDQQGQPITVGADGTVAPASLGVFAVTGPRKAGDNLFTGTAAGQATGQARSGALEDSGVDPARAMIDMIASLRAFESGQKAIQTIDATLDQAATKVGSRRAQAIAKIGLAVTHSEAGWRGVAASMAPTIRRCPAIERLLEERAPVRGPDDLLPAIDRDVSPIDDIRSTAHYRRQVMARLLYHDLRERCGWP